jgi:FkbM family methyltransferase
MVRLQQTGARSASQHGQDVWVIARRGESAGGFFVEVGAYDGIEGSNTLMLERDHGWRGILVEPNPLVRNRLLRNRPASLLHFACVTGSTGHVVEFHATEEEQLSTIASHTRADQHAAKRANYVPFQVPTICLNDLLSVHNAPYEIDYISLDTEGAELEILQNFDFRSHRVHLWTIEHNRTASESSIDGIMRANGYRRVLRRSSQVDGWYVLHY